MKIDLSAVKNDWISTGGPFHARKIADHYKIFDHLFGKHAFFTPRVSLNIKFKISDDIFCPVYIGNVSSAEVLVSALNQRIFQRIKPSQASSAPEVVFDHKFSMDGNSESKKDSLWTLVMTNLDGSPSADKPELIHWMV